MFEEKHGLSRTRLYSIWYSMNSRCYRPDTNDYARYGGRGITICDAWRVQSGPVNFCEWAVANGYRDDLMIDRRENSKPYEPENCRWVTPKRQARHRANNRLIQFEGRTLPMADWADVIGIPYAMLKARIKMGWPPERALQPRMRRQRSDCKAQIGD